MRLLHTSDWHLGRSFHGVGLLAAQASYLDHLVDVVRSERVGAVLVSGDIYDRALPGPEAVQLLDDTLARLRDAGAEVVLSSGNHDSSIRLGFGSRVLAAGGVHVRTRACEVGSPVSFDGVTVYPIPYLEPAVSAPSLGAARATHADVLRAAMQRIRADADTRDTPYVVMAHAFVVGGTTSESERDISVGGVSAVPASVFDGASYAALGHLHGPQQVGDTARYSGSPVAMSFSESDQTKSSVLVDVDHGHVSHQLITAPAARSLVRLRGELDDLLADPTLADAEDAWCQVTLTDPTRPLAAMERLRARFPHTLHLMFAESSTLPQQARYAHRVTGRQPLELCCDFLEHTRGGTGATAAERDLLQRAVQAARIHDDADERAGRRAVGPESGVA